MQLATSETVPMLICLANALMELAVELPSQAEELRENANRAVLRYE